MGITVGTTTITCDCCGHTCDPADPATYQVEPTLGDLVLCTSFGTGKSCMEQIRGYLVAPTGSLSYTVTKAAHVVAGGSSVTHP